MSERARSLGARWLGVGLASCLAVVTVALAATGRLALYVNPDSAWFVVGMAVVVLAGAVASFALPLGAEADHGHDHGDPHDHDPPHDGGHSHDDHADAHRPPARRPSAGRTVGAAATAVGGLAASGVVVAMLVVPPAALSAELAMSRDVGTAPLFAGSDVVTLASSGDTTQFGVGDWAGVFATATTPDTFDGDPVTLTGFVTPGGPDGFSLTRLVITHCVIDAQTATLPVAAASVPGTGQWVTVTGTVRSTGDGRLEVRADEVRAIDEPQDPYEY